MNKPCDIRGREWKIRICLRGGSHVTVLIRKVLFQMPVILNGLVGVFCFAKSCTVLLSIEESAVFLTEKYILSVSKALIKGLHHLDRLITFFGLPTGDHPCLVTV